MTPEEFKAEMERIVRECGWDNESSHSEGDNLMCKVLRELGYGAGVEIFEQMDKWYA